MDDIKSIKESVDIVEIISSYGVELELNGNEYKACCPFHEEKTPSFTVTPNLSKFYCFGCGAKGDQIDFVEKIEGLSKKDAINKLKNSFTPGESVKKVPSKKIDYYAGLNPSPDFPKLNPGDTIPLSNPKTGKTWKAKLTDVYFYKGQGYVVRIDMFEKKQTPMIRFCGGKWVSMPFDDPRPIYNFSGIDKQIIIVEGEKAAKAAQLVCDNLSVITWAGGTNAISKTDWKPLEGARVIMIPDADEEGLNAMAFLYGIICDKVKSIKIVEPPHDLPKGWDVADRDWSGQKELVDFCKENIKDMTQKDIKPNADTEKKTAKVVSISDKHKPRGDVDWRISLMFKEDGVKIQANVHNAIVLLTNHPDLSGVFAFNDFAKEVQIVKSAPWDRKGAIVPRSLQDEDATMATAWLERAGCKVQIATAQKCLISASRNNIINPVHDYLNNLEWDGKERLDGFLHEKLGAPDSAYTRYIGKRFLIGSVARALDPGCKMDTMLILEGDQGLKKSTAVSELFGYEWTTDELADFGSKDAALQVQGVWAVEVAELSTMNRSESGRIKEWLTRRADRFRPPYGMNLVKAPRQCVLIGTVNPEGGYLKDSTGARRFWPVLCSKISINAIRQDRDQLWAEAVALYKKGERWWLEGEENESAEFEQSERYDEDTWEDEIERYLSRRETTTIANILNECLEIPHAQQNQVSKTRVSKILKSKKWSRRRRRMGDSMQWYYYKFPEGKTEPLV